MGRGGGFPFGAPISPWSGSSPASPAGPCHPGPPPFAAVLVPVFSLSSSGALVCFVRGCFFFYYCFSPLVARPFPWHVGLSSVPPPCPLATPSLSSPLSLVGGGVGSGGGGAPSLSFFRRVHVAGTALARGAALVPLLGSGACRVAPVVALPTLRSLPRCPPRWGLHGACFLRARSCGPSRTLSPLPPHLAALSSGGGAAVRPSLPSSPTLGGAGVCGGGGGLSSSLRCTHVAGTTQSRRRHEARHPSLCRGGGHALRLPSSPFLPCARTPGGPPAGACTARNLFGHGRVVRPAPSYRCLPTLPRCPRGGGRFSPPPYPHFPPSGGRGWVGGEGRPCRLPFVARMTQARHKHGVRHLAAAGGRGGFPFGPSRPSPWYRLRTPGSTAAVAPRG